jgi:hypothetical protein
MEAAMGSYFKGWSQMSGCVFLAFSIALCLGWVRSLTHWDYVGFASGMQQFGIGSSSARITLSTHKVTFGDGYFGWRSGQIVPVKPAMGGVLEIQMPRGYREAGIPYWPPTLILTAASAFMILWRRKQST